MKKMDRWLPKGNPPTSSSSEGAFERFLTAAIATIITIIFSWRMLDKINEDREEDEYDPERHKLGHASSLSQSSFVSFSPTLQERTSLNYLTLGETSQFRSQSVESHRVVSLSERASRGEFNTGGFRFQLETIIRVPVDFPLCGDSPERSTRARSAKNSEHAEALGNPSDSKEVFQLGLTRDSQLVDCFIDRTSPGADQVGDTQQQHGPVITANQSFALLQPTDGLDSRAEQQISCTDNLDSSTTTNRNSISDSSLECIPNDLTDLSDSSIEEAGYACNENNSDLFLNASNDCIGYDNAGDNEYYQDIITEKKITTSLHTTDDADVDDHRSDDYFIALSDGQHHHFDQEYDFDDDVQPRELDSDEELFCCSLLEPIIEEDSDDITTSSEGDNSRSDKSSNKLQFDLNLDVPSHEDSESSGILTYNFNSTPQFELDINQDDAVIKSDEQDTQVASRKCVSEVTDRIPDPDINKARSQNINTTLATGPDKKVSIGSEPSSVAHTVQVRAELFTPAVNNRANENSFPEENHSQNIPWIGSSVDRFFSNSVSEQTQEDNDCVQFDNRLNQLDADKIIDDAEADSVFGKQSAPYSFMHTFSTRVEFEDSNSESDESVQTVISRKTSGELEGSPKHVSYLTSGLRTSQEPNKRPYSDGVLYSSKRWIDEEKRDAGRRPRNDSEGGGVSFREEADSFKYTVDSLPGRGHSNLQSYKSFTAQDLSTLTGENFDSELDSVPELRVTDTACRDLKQGEFSNIDFRHRGGKANKYERNYLVTGTVPGAPLFESGEQTDQPDNAEWVREQPIWDFEEKHDSDVKDKFLENETLKGEIITGFKDHGPVYSNISQDTSVMDASGRWSSYYTEEESRDLDNNRQDYDDEDWEEEEVIEETFVLPLPPERSFVNALQSVKSMLDKSESDRSSQVLSRDEEDYDEDEEHPSSCVTTMIEVEGHGALGFTGTEDVSSGYRDQCHELERTDRDVKGKLGFKLNMDEYKSNEYSSEDGWPITRYVEKERVYIDENVPSNKSPKQDAHSLGDTRGIYRKDDLDNRSQTEMKIRKVAEEKPENKSSQTQEDDDEEEVHYVEEHIEVFRMKNYNFGKETSESDKTRPLGWRNNDGEKLFFENRSTFYQPSSSRQYTLFGPNTGSTVSNNQTVPEMTSDNLYAPLNKKIGNVQRGDEEMYSPYTNTSHNYSGSFPQNNSRDVFAQNNTHGFPSFADNNKRGNNSSRGYTEGAYKNIFTEDDPQGVSSPGNTAQSETMPTSNYDEFVNHILSKNVKLQTMEGDYTQVSPTQAGSILSGNVTSSQTLNSPSTLPTNENQHKDSVVPSYTFSTDKFYTHREELWRDEISQKYKSGENEEPEIMKKPRFTRTSTAQDEEELLKFKVHEERHDSGSFEVSNRNSFEFERRDPWSSGESNHTANINDHDSRTKLTQADIKLQESDFSHFPTNPRRFNFSDPFSEPSHDIAPEATLRTRRSPQDNSPVAENEKAKHSSTNSPSFLESPSLTESPTKPPSPIWACVIAGPNFTKQTPAQPSEREQNISRDSLSTTVSSRTTTLSRDMNKTDKPAEVGEANTKYSPTVKPFAFTQATISLTSTLNTLPAASGLTKAPGTHRLSGQPTPQENAMPRASDLRLPLVSSSAFRFLQERPSQTSAGDRKNPSSLAQFKNKESDTKVEATNTKEEKRKAESSYMDYRGGKGDTELEEMKNNDRDTTIAGIRHYPTGDMAGKSQSVGKSDYVPPDDSFSTSETASSATSFDSVEPAVPSTQVRLSAAATPISRQAPPNEPSWIPDLPKKPKTLKEIKKRYKQPYKSVLTQNPSGFPQPKAAPFVVPDHLITPSRMKILQARNQFLSDQNLHTDPFDCEFTAHKESLTPTGVATTSKDRKYTSRTLKQSTYRSQEQLEKIMYMVSLKPGRSEGSLNVDCLHDDCILSEAGRREILDKTLSIDNLDARLHSRLGNMRSYINGPMSDSFDPETNSDLFDLTFPYQDEFNRQLDRPASMGELRLASGYSTVSGPAAWALSSPGSKYQDQVSPKQNKKSKSLGTLETNDDTGDFETSARADGLDRPLSAHELRISKSLQKLNVPDWYKYVSVTKNGNFMPRCRSATSINSRATSASLASSPSTTPSLSSNVVIKSRVLFPTTARNLRSPYNPSKSAPTTPSLTSWADDKGKNTPTTVKLPSESMRTAEKPPSLMPIPTLPLDRIRFIVEKKKEIARDDHPEVKQTFAVSTFHSSTVKQTFAVSTFHSSTVSQPPPVTPARVSPTDSFDITAYNEDETPEEVIPEVIVSPTDPSVRSILKRPTSERTEWGDHKPTEPEVEYPRIKADSRKVPEFPLTMTLFREPVYSNHTSDLSWHHDSPQVTTERPAVPEWPASIEITEVENIETNPVLLYDSDDQFISQNNEEDWRPLPPPVRPSQQRTPLWSSFSSPVEIKSQTDRPRYTQEEQNVNTSLEPADVFPETDPSMLSPVTSSFPPTIIVTPETPRPAASHYVNVVVVEPTAPVTILERAPVIRPPGNKPFIAPVIEDHSITDTPPYFTEYSTQHEPRTWSSSSESFHGSDLNTSGRQDKKSKPVHTTTERQRTWSRSSESIHESDINNSFDRQDKPNKPAQTEDELRTWSRSSESFQESDTNHSFSRNNVPHKPVATQAEPRISSRSSESFNENDLNSSFIRSDISAKPVSTQAELRSWSRSSESFHESDVNSFYEQDLPRKPVQTQAQPRTWSRSSESFHEGDPNNSFSHNDKPHRPVQSQTEPGKKRTWVPKPKPHRKFRSLRELDKDLTETESTDTPVVQTTLRKYVSVEKVYRVKSPVELESQEESALSEESSSENRFRVKDKPGRNFPRVIAPAPRETDLERPYDSYSSRSTHNFQDLAQEDVKTTMRKPIAQSSPNFSRSLDRVLDRYTSQDEEHPDDVSDRYTAGSTPTEDTDRTSNSVREGEYTVSNGDINTKNLRQSEYTEGNYDWDARGFINGTFKDNRPHTEYSRTGIDSESQNRDFNNSDYDGRHSPPYGHVQYEGSERDYEESQPEYNRRGKDNTTRQQARDTASAEDLTYSLDSEQDSIRDYASFRSAPGAATKSRTMPGNWTVPGNSKSHMDLSETYGEPVSQRKPGRTWQPKPKKGRGLKHSTVKHAFSTGDILHRGSVASLESKVSPEASPYKYKVAGSAFSSAKPDARAGLITPPSERRGSSGLAGSVISSNETTV